MKKNNVADVAKTDLCTGCLACVNSCPNKAISISINERGFYTPNVDMSRCDRCHRCIDVCDTEIGCNKPLRYYACQIKDKNTLVKSTSGGFFPLLCKVVLHNGGIVFGAAYNDSMEITHIGINKIEDINRIMGSKYAESNIGNSYSLAGDAISEGKMVLFSGTPCQIRGLLSYLIFNDIEYEKLLVTVDVICYGIPSARLFKKCIDYYQNEFNDTVIDYSFRDKTKFGWSHTTRICFKNHNCIYSYLPGYDPYYRLWSKTELCLRDSCYNCKLVGINRVSDFTIGNYWGAESLNNSEVFEINNGISMVLVNSKKGMDYFNMIKDDMIYIETDIDHCLKYEHGLKKNKEKSNLHDSFCMDINNNSLVYCIDKYAPYGKKAKLLLALPYWIRNIIFYQYKKHSFISSGVRL